MKNAKIIVASAALLGLLGAAVFIYGNKPERMYIDPSDREMVLRGKTVYASHCASCHGAKLEGQPEWRKRLPNGRLPAPPHDVSGHTWHHPDAVLIDIVKHGLVPGKTAPDGYRSDMPAFGASLPDADIAAVLAYIKSTWPADALEAQKNVTLQRE